MEAIRRCSLQWLLVCALVYRAACDQEEDVCSTETVEMECPDEQKVSVVDAVYGVIELGRCNQEHSGNPCYKEVTEFLNERCTNVAACYVTVSDIHLYVNDNLDSLSGTEEICDMQNVQNQFIKVDYECVYHVSKDDKWERPEPALTAGASPLYATMTVCLNSLTAAVLAAILA